MKKALSICFSTSGSLRPKVDGLHNYFSGFLIMAAFFLPFYGNSQQQVPMSEFVLFSGATSPGNVQIGSSSNINGGTVGSLKLVKSTGTASVTGNIYSQGTINLANSNTVTGKIAASNSPVVSGTILTIGSSANLSGNIDVNGNIVVGGGVVSGKVTHPTGTTYTGPTPALGNITGTPSLPVFPSLPTITTFPSYNNSLADITTTQTITPGIYNSIKLSGNQTLTLKGAGIYVFNLIDNKNGNTFVFDFDNKAGNFLIYVHNNISLNKLNSNIINGGSASRIYTEVQGTGLGTAKYAFDIANGSPGATKSRWTGTVWAPYAAINIGSGTGNSEVTGALWSGTQVNIQSGVNVIYAPYVIPTCTNPNVNAGLDKVLTCAVTTVKLDGASTTSGVTYNWVASNGGNILSGATTATPTVNAAGTYTLTVSLGSCSATDIALVTLNNTVPNANAGIDKSLTCSVTSVQLSGSSSTSGVTYNWVATNGGNILSGASTATPTVNSAGTYTLTVTATATGCTSTDVALVTLDNTAPNANAGADKSLTCSVTAAQLGGSSSTSGVTYSWVATNGGIILSGATTATPTVNTAGTYTLTVTVTATGCTSTDVALVTLSNTVPTLTVNNAIVCSNADSSTKSNVDLTGYVIVGAGITTTYSNNGALISDPTNHLTTNGDVITVVASNSLGCKSDATFTVSVIDRQKFGVCAPIAGKVYEIIGSELTMLEDTFDPAHPTVSSEVFYINGDSVLIEIVFFKDQLANLLPILERDSMGFKIDPDISDFEDDLIIAGYFPIMNLKKLNKLKTLIKFVRPAFHRLATT